MINKKIGDIVPTPDLFVWSAHLFIGKRILTTLFQSPAFCSFLLSILLQTIVSYPELHSLVTYITSTHYL